MRKSHVNVIHTSHAHYTHQECIKTRVRACNYVIFETRQNFPPVLKIVTHTAHTCVRIHVSHFVNVVKRAHDESSFLVWFNNFPLTTGFYWSFTLFLKSLVLRRSYTHIHVLYAIPNGNVLCNTDNKAS